MVTEETVWTPLNIIIVVVVIIALILLLGAIFKVHIASAIIRLVGVLFTGATGSTGVLQGIGKGIFNTLANLVNF